MKQFIREVENGNGLDKVLTTRSVSEIGKEFLRMLIFLTIAVCTSVFLFLHSGFQNSLDLIEKKETEHIKLLKFSMVRDLEVILADLNVLSNSDVLTNYVESSGEINLASLENRLAVFASDRKIYSQLRFIDMQGMERVRINYQANKALVVPRDQLQNKKERYYFKEAISKQPGEIYLSKLDLNFEQGRVEEPYNPMLRVAQPVFTSSRERAGIVVLNYRAQLMIDRLKRNILDYDSRNIHSLLNQDGYWLKANDKEKEWGFVLHHNNTFSSTYPEAWLSMQEKMFGRVRSAEGLYLFDTINPLKELGYKVNKEDSQENHELWYIVSLIPAADLSFYSYVIRHRQILLAVFGFFVLLILGVWQSALARVTKKRAGESFRLLSRGLSQSPAAVVITDKHGAISYVNPRFEQLTGYSSSEVLGKNPRIFKSGSTSDVVYSELWTTIKEGNTWRGDFENKDKSDKPYFVSAQISPIVDERGEIEHFIGIQEDVTEKVILQKKLEELASTDSLTGALNRGHFMAKCEQEVSRRIRYGHPLSLLIFDLDRFKQINDNFGHHGGDEVLIRFAREINKNLREHDIFGRIGGEEFAALLVETEKEGCLLLAERLRRKIESVSVNYDGRVIQCTVSIGCTEWVSVEEKVSEVFKRADDALYDAKKQGRNRVVYG